MSPRVVVSFDAQPDQRAAIEEILQPLGDVAYLADVDSDQDKRAELLGSAQAVLGWYLHRELTEADYRAMTGVGLLQTLSAGTDHVDFSVIPDHVKLAGNVGAYADPIAEHVVGMALALAKKLPYGHAELAAGRFTTVHTHRLRGGTAGILGYGGIGQASADLLRAFGMRIYAINRSGRADGADQAGTLGDLPAMLAAADIVVVSVPLTRATRGLIGAAELATMKPDAVLVNVARGAIIDEEALYAHLLAHPGFSAGLDTWWEEPGFDQPFRPRLPFLGLPNVLGSPHNSGFVPGMGVVSAQAAARNIATYLRGDPPQGIQDPADYA